MTGGPWHEEVRGQSLEKGVVKSAQVVNGPSKGLLMKGDMREVSKGVGRVKECFLLLWGKPYP